MPGTQIIKCTGPELSRPHNNLASDCSSFQASLLEILRKSGVNSRNNVLSPPSWGCCEKQQKSSEPVPALYAFEYCTDLSDSCVFIRPFSLPTSPEPHSPTPGQFPHIRSWQRHAKAQVFLTLGLASHFLTNTKRGEQRNSPVGKVTTIQTSMKSWVWVLAPT